MHLPIQREPVQRTLAGQPCAAESRGFATGADSSGQGVRAGEYGVQPSGGVDWGSIASAAIPILASLF
jgi:hypothetical protein